MKKSSFILIALAVGVLLGVSCSRDENMTTITEPKGEVIQLTVRAELPEPTPGDEGTRLSMDPSVNARMAWDGAETMYVLAGKGEPGSLEQKVFTLTGGVDANLGVFTGELDFSGTTLGLSDIKAVVLSYAEPELEYNSSQLRVKVPSKQVFTQEEYGILDGTWAVAYSLVSEANFTTSGPGYELNGVSLQYARPVVQFTVYDSSSNYSAYKLKEVRFYAKWICGASYVNVSTGTPSGGQSYNHTNVNLPATETVPSSQVTGLRAFIPIAHPSTHQMLYCAAVMTDGVQDTIIYRGIDPVGRNQTFESGKLYNINFDLAHSKCTPGMLYSTDEGTTWSSSLPTSEFSKLATWRVGGNLALENLNDVVGAILDNGAAGGVELDLSRNSYSSASFPRVFGSSTTSTTDSSLCLKGIKLPSNITTLSNNAFCYCQNLRYCEGMDKVKVFGSYVFRNCSNLQSIDVSAATQLFAYAFQNCANATGSLSIPSTVTTMGIYTFTHCRGLSEIRVDAPLTANNDNGRMFAFASKGLAKTHDLTITYGATVQNIRGREFLWNTNVIKVVCEGSPIFGYAFIGGASNLKTIELRGASVPTATSTADPYALTNDAVNAPVPTGGTIVIPKTATASDYSSVTPWKELVNDYSWTIVNSDTW